MKTKQFLIISHYLRGGMDLSASLMLERLGCVHGVWQRGGGGGQVKLRGGGIGKNIFNKKGGW